MEQPKKTRLTEADQTDVPPPVAAPAPSLVDQLRALLSSVPPETLAQALPASMQGQNKMPVGQYPRSEGRAKTARLEAVREVFYDGKRFGPGDQFDCDEQNAVEFTRVFTGVYAFSGLRPADGSDAQLGQVMTARRIGKAS